MSGLKHIFGMIPATCILIVSMPRVSSSGDDLCLAKDCVQNPDSGKECTFKVGFDIFASEAGLFTFEGCEGVSPTLGIEFGTTYKFEQEGVMHSHHPLGFSYQPDGWHDGHDELEADESCIATDTCPAIRHYRNSEYLGSEDPEEYDNGIDSYEEDFFGRTDEFAYSNHMVSLMIPEEMSSGLGDIFYFDHGFAFASGRIKFVDSQGTPLPDKKSHEIPYDVPSFSPFDKRCGTYKTGKFKLVNGLGNKQCPSRFICGRSKIPKVQNFIECMEAIDCKALAEVTTKGPKDKGNDVSTQIFTLYAHQQMPTLRDAVNKAKAILRTGVLEDCQGLSDEMCWNREMQFFATIDTINNNNKAIAGLRAGLDEYDVELENDCKLKIRSRGIIKDPSPRAAESAT